MLDVYSTVHSYTVSRHTSARRAATLYSDEQISQEVARITRQAASASFTQPLGEKLSLLSNVAKAI